MEGPQTPLPDADTIRQQALDVLKNPEYKINPSETDIVKLWEKFGAFLGRIIGPLRKAFAALYDISPILAWLTFIVLLLILIALVWHIAYTLRAALRNKREESLRAQYKAAQRETPGMHEQAARQALAQNDYIGAIRSLFRAGLLRLELAQKRELRKGMTNREFLQRYRNTPASEPLAYFVETIDRKWYGEDRCTLEDYQNSLHAYEKLCRVSREAPRAKRA